MLGLATILMSLVFLFGCDSGHTGAGGQREQGQTSSARPQEPQEPYPYASEEVIYGNGLDDGVVAGTLTHPQSGGPFPAVLLLSGSGFQDRDETVYGHKPFLVMADYLTRRGIAVLRIDDRGVGGSTGDVVVATPEAMAEDALAGVRHLASRSDINGRHIGLIGHSEGAIVAAIAATRSNEVAFIIALAGLGIPWWENALLAQEEGLRRLGKTPEEIAATRDLMGHIREIVATRHDPVTTEARLRSAIDRWRESLDGIAKQEIEEFTRAHPDHWDYLADLYAEPVYQYYLELDPRSAFERIRCPVLALCGGNDIQVMADVNLDAIGEALRKGGNLEYDTRKLGNLNHLLQHCETGLTSEYARIEETFAPEAMEIVADWITTQTGGHHQHRLH